METIGNIIARELRVRKLSQTALAKHLKISQQQVSYNLGRGDNDIAVGFVKDSCEFIGISAASVLLQPGEMMTSSGVNPVIAPIVEELNRIADTKSRTEQGIIFAMELAALKAV